MFYPLDMTEDEYIFYSMYSAYDLLTINSEYDEENY
jgi:hypothetical protein